MTNHDCSIRGGAGACRWCLCSVSSCWGPGLSWESRPVLTCSWTRWLALAGRNMCLQMIGELVRDPTIANLELPDQSLRHRVRLGLLRPVIDLKLVRPRVSGLGSLERSSEAVMRYSEKDGLPNFDIKFSARLSNIKVNSPSSGKVLTCHSGLY